MKKLFLMLTLMLTMISCGAQNLQVEPIQRGHTIGIVIEADDTKAIVNAGGRSLIVNGKLEVGIEYDLVYEIIERRPDGVLIVNLVDAEESARQNTKDRAKLLLLLKN